LRMSMGPFLRNSSPTEFIIVVVILAVGVVIEHLRKNREKREAERVEFICLLLMMPFFILYKLARYFHSDEPGYVIAAAIPLAILFGAFVFIVVRKVIRRHKRDEMTEDEKARLRSGLWSLLVFVLICISIAAVLFLLAHFGVIK